MIPTIDAPAWPIRVITIESGSPVVRWKAAEFRHHGIALRSHAGAIDALLDLGKEPGSVILVPTDLTDMPLLEFVELAVSLGNAPVIIGRAAGSDGEIATSCLKLGAHGVVDLPITPERLAVAIFGIVRTDSREPEVLQCGSLTLDRGQHRVHYSGQEIGLALKEFALLEHLMRIHPRVASTDDLARQFGAGDAGDAMRIRVAVRRLRLKMALVAPMTRPVVETVRGIGYRIAV